MDIFKILIVFERLPDQVNQYSISEQFPPGCIGNARIRWEIMLVGQWDLLQGTDIIRSELARVKHATQQNDNCEDENE
jgi:hypothetical protein